MARPTGKELSVDGVFDPTKHDELAKAVAQLSPEEAAFFLSKLEAVLAKRKIQLTGYLVAMCAWLVGMIAALWYYGTHDGFVGWVFFLPFGLVGGVLWYFGRRAERTAARLRAATASPAAPPSADSRS